MVDWIAAGAACVAAAAAIVALLISRQAIQSQERLALKAMQAQAKASLKEIQEARRLSRDERNAGGRAALYLDLIALGQERPPPPEALKSLAAMNGRILLFASGEVQRAVRQLESLLGAYTVDYDEDAVPRAWRSLGAAMLLSRFEEDLEAEQPPEANDP